MSTEALARVPMSDWMLALAVVACGAVAIAAVWRCTGRLSDVVVLADPGRPEGGIDPISETPKGPGSDETPELDDVDRALWAIIEEEYRHRERRAVPSRARSGALLRRLAPAPSPAHKEATAPWS